MVGFGQSQNCTTNSKSVSSTRRHSATVVILRWIASLRSKPAEKARPSPWMTIASTCGSAVNCRTASPISRTIAPLKAFSTFGRLSVSTPVRPSTRVRIVSKLILLVSLPVGSAAFEAVEQAVCEDGRGGAYRLQRAEWDRPDRRHGQRRHVARLVGKARELDTHRRLPADAAPLAADLGEEAGSRRVD